MIIKRARINSSHLRLWSRLSPNSRRKRNCKKYSNPCSSSKLSTPK